MTEDKKYNGWNNYETWNVALWIDNEQGSYSERCDLAQIAWDDTDISESLEDRTSAAVSSLAKYLELLVEEMRPDLGASMFSDLLSAALSEVDWYEIAENFLEDVDKPEQGVCKHCGATGEVGEECDNCEPQDDLGPMIFQRTEVTA